MTDPSGSVKLSVSPLWLTKVGQGPCSTLCCALSGLLVGASEACKQEAGNTLPQALRLSAETGEILARHCSIGAGTILHLLQGSRRNSFLTATSASHIALCDESHEQAEAGCQHATRLAAKSSQDGGLLHSTSIPSSKQLSSELKAVLDGHVPEDRPAFMAEGGFRGVRPGYLFRHGTCGLGYYRADKLVELDARHHDRPEGISAVAKEASELPEHDEQRACSSPMAEPPVQVALEQPNRHQPGQECNVSPAAAWPCSNVTAEQVRGRKDAADSEHSAKAAEGNQTLTTAASAAAPDTSTRAQASNTAAAHSAPDPLQSSAHDSSGTENAADSRSRLRSSHTGSRDFSMSHTQTEVKSMTALPTSTAASSLEVTAPLVRHPAGVMHLKGESSQQTAARAPDLYCCCLCPEQGLVLAGSAGHTDNSFTVWSLRTGQLLQQVQGHSAPVLCLTTTKDGSLFLSGSYDKTIRVWQASDGRLLKTLSGHRSGVRALALAVDGNRFFSASSDNTIRIWDMKRWICLRAMTGRHADTTWPSCLALSPDGALLASGSTGPFGQATVKIFSTQGECLATCAHLTTETRGDMTGVAFAADSSTLFSAASDGSVASWHLVLKASATARPGFKKGFM